MFDLDINADKLKQGLDFQTPMYVCKYMAGLVPKLAKTVFEPTKGAGNLVKALEATGKTVIAPDDYFLFDRTQRVDAVCMNPPFSSKYAYLENAKGDYSKHGMRLGYQILTECMEMSDYVTALMPWFTLSDSDVRLRFLKNWGLVSVTALPRKTFQYARIQTVVIQLEKGFVGDTSFKVFDLLKPTSPNLFDITGNIV